MTPAGATPLADQRALGAALACTYWPLRQAALDTLSAWLDGRTLEQAAEVSGVPLRTLKRWLALPGVRNALGRA